MRGASGIGKILLLTGFFSLGMAFAPPVCGQPTEAERKDRQEEKWKTAVVAFAPAGEFYGFSRTGRWTAHWELPWVAGLSDLIAPPKARDVDISSPRAWTSDGHGLLIVAIARDRQETGSSYRLLALGLPAMRLLGRADLDGPFTEAPKLRFDSARSLLEVEGPKGRQTFTPSLRPAASKTTSQESPVDLRKALGETAFSEIKRLKGADRLEDAEAEGWLASFVLDASDAGTTLLVPGDSESRAVRLERGKPGSASLVRAPRTQRDHIALDPSGRRMLVEELEARPRPDLGRPDNFATGRLVLLDLAAGKAAGSIEDPRLAGFLGGPLCVGENGDAVVAGDHGLFLVRWSPKAELIQLLPDSKRNDWLGCVFTER
jgi:hypothetical protein